MISQENRSDTKLRILEVSLMLFAEQGFEKTSIREIAKTVGIKGPSIYNHFTSKDEILKALFFDFTSFSMRASLLNHDNIEYLIDSPKEFPNFFKRTFRGWLLNEQWRKYIRLILTEMFRNEAAKKIFLDEMVKKGEKINESFFKELKQHGIIKNLPVSKVNRLVFWPVFLMEVQFILEESDEEAFMTKVGEHVDFVWELIKK